MKINAIVVREDGGKAEETRSRGNGRAPMQKLKPRGTPNVRKDVSGIKHGQQEWLQDDCRNVQPCGLATTYAVPRHVLLEV